jgi:hypothetical protein
VKGGDQWRKEMKIRSIYYSSAFIGLYQYEVVRRTGLIGSSGCATLTFGKMSMGLKSAETVEDGNYSQVENTCDGLDTSEKHLRQWGLHDGRRSFFFSCMILRHINPIG